ncbi:unnamed protein product [Dibothriocephalus latus]|uniref:KY-like immunoglobulin-like domain-containing protein n=1 Tax=Dibothriocephalus latus TaxID=60516 RepID=A0A3P7MNU2_DIBLA|nr:unnamed protein product [Dibothriocephalus latus]
MAAHNEFRTKRGQKPLSANFELESLGHRRPAFFENNLSLLSHPNAVIVSAEPEIRIVVGFPSGSENILFFDTTLTFDDQDSSEPPDKDVPLMYVF